MLRDIADRRAQISSKLVIFDLTIGEGREREGRRGKGERRKGVNGKMGEREK